MIHDHISYIKTSLIKTITSLDYFLIFFVIIFISELNSSEGSISVSCDKKII